MRAAWYARAGPAAEVFRVGEVPGRSPDPVRSGSGRTPPVW